ncbi:FAD-dependent oxidoreductase [Microbispora sp. ATCC PTA-5024]|uniref:FAD-dependent oxidoreductase n=1 Tax=Microbispora sp. ATCC PTA-5024 TaxID=316330 RepID=UPI0003DD873F|nr:cyclic nucleotide-binding domain-containing thioredoxin-disulfide reductase [Microbispora sp. ATCC PTA-5024]ETK35313.1 cyclic nucleotide-binding protein [Microbispora sp. ATCC PTA-5024]
MRWPDELTESPDLQGAYPRLSDTQMRTLAAHGERRPAHRDDVLFAEGDPCAAFFVVLSGKVATVKGYGVDDQVIRVHGAGRFLGELNVLTGQASFVTGVVAEDGEVLDVPVDELRRLVADDEILGDLVMRAYLIRRSMLIGLGAGFRIVGSRYSQDCRRLREFAARNRLPHRWIDLEQDAEVERFLRRMGITPAETPVVIWRGELVLRNPTNAELARAIGLPAPSARETVCDLLIVGAGPAGLAAAVYGASEGLATVVFDSVALGGQAGTSSRIENYLGFPAGISGGELAERAMIQARKFGAELSVPAEACALREHEGYHVVTLKEGTTVHARTLLIVTGVRYRRLDVPNLERYEGTSVYYAATEFEAQMCSRDPVVVVGGGNSAGQAALFLARQVACVRLLVREASLTRNMSRYLADEIEHHPRIRVMPNTEVRELAGEGTLEAVVVENNVTGERFTVEARAMFVFIGAEPYTRWLADEIALDSRGYILTGLDAARSGTKGVLDSTGRPFPLETSRAGVFAAGDVRHGSIKRVASAVGEGAMAVRLVHEHLK